jgi:hypothetical protein
LLTLPLAGLLGAGAYWLADPFGSGALGPLLISVIALAAVARGLAVRHSDLGSDIPHPLVSSPPAAHGG